MELVEALWGSEGDGCRTWDKSGGTLSRTVVTE